MEEPVISPAGGQYKLLALSSILHGFNHSFWVVLPVLLPSIIQDLGINVADAGLLVTAFFLPYALFQLAAGVISERVGPKATIGLGQIVSSTGVVLSGVSAGFWDLLAFQAVAGLGGGTFHPTALTSLSDVFHPKKRGRALGVFGFAASASFLLTPIGVAYFAEAGWRAAFLILGFIGIGAGAAYLAFAGGKEIEGGRPGKAATPRALLAAIRDRHVAYVTLANTFASMTERGVITFIPLLLIFAYNLAAPDAGRYLSVIYLLAMAVQPLSGVIADRANKKLLAQLLLATIFLSVLAIALLPPFPLMLLLMATFGVGFYGFITVINTIASIKIPHELRSQGFAIYFTVGILAGSATPTLAGHLIQAYSYQLAYGILAVMVLLSLPLVRLVTREPSRRLTFS